MLHKTLLNKISSKYKSFEQFYLIRNKLLKFFFEVCDVYVNLPLSIYLFNFLLQSCTHYSLTFQLLCIDFYPI